MKKQKIKLNLKCSYCNKEIYIGEGAIIENKPLHFSCFKDMILKEILDEINELIKNEEDCRKRDEYLEQELEHINQIEMANKIKKIIKKKAGFEDLK